MTFVIKQNDTSPSIKYALEPASEIDLTGASVVFNMRDTSSIQSSQLMGSKRSGIQATVVISREPAIIIEASGSPTVQYDWRPEDTQSVGKFQAEFEVTYPNGTVETFPNEGYIDVSIGDDIA